MALCDLAADVRCGLGESPVWSARTQTLYHIDITGKAVFALKGGRSAEPLHLPAAVGCIVPRASGGLLACLESSCLPCCVETHSVSETPLFTVPPQSGVRYNDGKCDPAGRLWLGSMHSSWRLPSAAPGQLYCVQRSSQPRVAVSAPPYLLGGGAVAAAAAALAVGRLRSRSYAAFCGTMLGAGVLAYAALAADSSVGVVASEQPPKLRTVIDDARLPNGMTWSEDGRLFYWIDSATNNVDAFDFDVATGKVSNRRVVVRCPRQGASVHGAVGGIPDGMTIDGGGKLWVVLGESGCVVQYDSETGRQITAVALPVKRPTACTFGGADLSELYVTTREEGAGGSSSAGSLFRVRIPGVRGLHAAYEYAG